MGDSSSRLPLRLFSVASMFCTSFGAKKHFWPFLNANFIFKGLACYQCLKFRACFEQWQLNPCFGPALTDLPNSGKDWGGKCPPGCIGSYAIHLLWWTYTTSMFLLFEIFWKKHYSNIYMFSSIPTERRNVEFKLDKAALYAFINSRLFLILMYKEALTWRDPLLQGMENFPSLCLYIWVRSRS